MCYSANWLLVEPKTLIPWKKSYDQPRQHIKKQRHYFANKGPSSQGYILSPCLFNLYSEYVMRNAGLEEAQARIKIAGRNINNLRYADETTLMAESEEELKSLLMKVKVESGKSWLKAQHSENEDHGIWSHHFMADRWGNSRNSVRLLFWAPKSLQMVTAAMKLKDACSWKKL